MYTVLSGTLFLGDEKGSNTKINIAEITCENVNRFELVEDMVEWQGFVNTVMKLRVA
jgi:hypothetical protein